MKWATNALICFVVLAGCATKALPPVTSGDFVLEDDEKRLWLRSQEEEKALNTSGLIYRDTELEAYLNGIAKKLQPPEVFTRIQFKIIVIKNPLLNAFALPDGVVYIHTGILARMENEAQLATLLGHEMTHVTHRHLVKEFRDMKNKTAFLATVNVTVGGLGGLGSLATLASVTGYSRELETEADDEGLKLMISAGYDPYEAPKLFTHLKAEVEEEKIKEPFFFGSHPRLQERIDNYETLIKTQYPEQKGGIKNSELFLDKTHNVILDDAWLDLKVGRFKIAQKGTEKYLTIKSNDERAYYLLGEIFRQRGEKGDLEKAKEQYQKAISIDSSYPDPYKGIGLICYKQGDKSLARNFFERYLSLSPQASDRAYIEEYLKAVQ